MFAIVHEVNPSDRVQRMVDDILAAHPIAGHPYFESLATTMERAAFIETQRQFGFAVDYFSRPMAVLASRLPGPAQRIGILHNVWEEHGEGDLSLGHGATFRVFLQALSGSSSLGDPRSAVGAFNAALAGVCGVDEVLAGVGAMGMIERMFADISAFIGESVVGRGWVRRTDLVHYCTHETLDLEHAEDFFAIARATPKDLSHFERGARLGAHVFDQFYRQLLVESQR